MDFRDPKAFRFKRFEVHHHLSTFKVNTDAVILACIANPISPKKILDIGSGTGLISLILAQRYPKTKLLGVEIDKDSANQASYNASISPFKDRIDIVEADSFTYDYQGQYDCIICNPPYFTESTLPIKSKLSKAKHSDPRFLERLLALVEERLAPEGKFWFLFPSDHDATTLNLIEFQIG